MNRARFDAPPRPRLSVFHVGLVAHVALVLAISLCAYAGVLPTTVDGLPGADKLAHAVLIGAVAFFLDGVLRRRSLGLVPSLAAVLVIAAAGLEEYAQRFSPRRSSDVLDFAADVVGVVFFVWLSRRAATLVERRRTAPKVR